MFRVSAPSPPSTNLNAPTAVAFDVAVVAAPPLSPHLTPTLRPTHPAHHVLLGVVGRLVTTERAYNALVESTLRVAARVPGGAARRGGASRARLESALFVAPWALALTAVVGLGRAIAYRRRRSRPPFVQCPVVVAVRGGEEDGASYSSKKKH